MGKMIFPTLEKKEAVVNRAVVATTTKNGTPFGVILWYEGPDIHFDMEELGPLTEDLDIPPGTQPGLTIWEGTYRYSTDSWEHAGEENWGPTRGQHRPLTVPEWRAVRENRNPFVQKNDTLPYG